MEDLFYSFATTNPGALVLHNYPEPAARVLPCGRHHRRRHDRHPPGPRAGPWRPGLQPIPAPGSALPAADPLRRFRTTTKPSSPTCGGSTATRNRSISWSASSSGEAARSFAISETAFRVFILMASRRLKSDRFLAADYRPEVYTKEGLRWIEYNTLSSVLRRHYPTLGPALRDVENVFKPWDTTTNRRTTRWRWRRRFWNTLTSFKFVTAKPLRVPVPKDRTPVIPVPFTRKFRTYPSPASSSPTASRRTKSTDSSSRSSDSRSGSPERSRSPGPDSHPSTRIPRRRWPRHTRR